MKDDEERNTKILVAWNEWKEICSVMGCSEENRELLKMEIGNAFRRKLAAALAQKEMDSISTEKYEDYVQMFDSSLEIMKKAPGVNKKTGQEKMKKNYKDMVWQAIQNSKDPQLRIIRGLLFGGANNYATPLTAIVREYLEKNYNNGLRIDPKSLVSLNERWGDSDRDFEESIGELCTPVDMPKNDLEHLEELVQERFTLNEALVLLTTACNMPLTDASLLKCIGKNKTMAYEYFKEASFKIKSLFNKENYTEEIAPVAMKHILKKLFSMLEAEKSYDEYLSTLKEKEPMLND